MTAPSSSPAAPTPAPAATPSDWISYSLRHLERWVAWSIAVYTAWLALVLFPEDPVAWAMVLYAGLVGKWAEARPAHHQSEMAWRGVALIAGAFVLHTQTSVEAGGPGGVFFFWLSITCLYYAFMLKPAWGAGVVALAMLEFALVSLHAPAGARMADLLAQGGFLCVFPLLLAMKFGAVMRRPDEAIENGRVDPSTSLYNMDGFHALGNELLAACQREGRPATVAVFDCADLLEVRTIYGRRIARKLTARIVRKLTLLSGDRGLAARTGPAEFSLMLPGLSREKALSAIHRVMGNPMRVELDAGDNEIVLVPGLLVETAAADTESVDEMLLDLRREFVRLQDEQTRRHHNMQRDRVRHSRPMGITVLPEPRPPARRSPAQVSMDSTAPATLAAG